MSLPVAQTTKKHLSCQDLKEQLTLFQERLKRIGTRNFNELYWFAEAVEESDCFNAPEWAVCQFGDLEILIKRQQSNYRIKQVKGYRNPEPMFDAEGYLKDHYQAILPLSDQMEEVLSAFL